MKLQVQLSKGDSAAGQGEVDLSRGDKILRFIGWLGGFYSRKAVRETVVFYSMYCTSLVFLKRPMQGLVIARVYTLGNSN